MPYRTLRTVRRLNAKENAAASCRCNVAAARFTPACQSSLHSSVECISSCRARCDVTTRHASGASGFDRLHSLLRVRQAREKPEEARKEALTKDVGTRRMRSYPHDVAKARNAATEMVGGAHGRVELQHGATLSVQINYDQFAQST